MSTLTQTTNYIYSKKLSDLSKIHSPEINLVILPIEDSEEILEYLDFIEEQDSFSFRSNSKELLDNLSKLPIVSTNANNVFSQKIIEISNLYYELTKTENFFVQVDLVTKITCPKFHVDFTSIRLLYNLRGKCTEFVTNDSPYTLPFSEDQLDSSRIFLPTGSNLCLLKGESYPKNRGKAIIHKSPSLDAFEKRILLRIDTINIL
ncbi:MAG: DUF1826 domain-containing protein [Leptospiraceae bacterium]|nr:DUF1826 domain-containing protein [Leptospiraceae bacterium]